MRIYQFQSHDEDVDNNQQQSWLFPYANMMVLMCGFFAYLYTTNAGGLNSTGFGGLASNKKLNQNIQSSTATENLDPQAIMQVPEEVKKKIQEQQALIDRLALKTESLQAELAENKNKLGLTSNSASEREVEKKALQAQLDLLNKEKADLQAVLISQQTENQQLIEKVKLSEQQKTLEQQLRDIKEKEVKRKEAQIKNRDSQINQTNQNIEYTNNIIATQEAEISQLRAQLMQAKTELSGLPQNLMFILKWSTAVDLDLSVVDPNGKKFDYSRRSIAGVDGKISVESKSGPGTEIWEAAQFVPGQYRLRVTYKPDQIGTKRASGFVLQASTSRDSKESLMFTVDLNNRQKEVLVIVDQRGRIAFK